MQDLLFFPLRSVLFQFLRIACMLALVTAVAYSETQITGHVIDATTGEPILGATVRLVSSNQAVATDSEGRFSLPVPGAGEIELIVTHVRYQRQEKRFELVPGSVTEVTFNLTPAVVPVGSITVLPMRSGDDKFNVPQSVSVTTSEEFAKPNPTTTADVLRDDVGVLVQKTTHAHGSPIIRGLLGKYVLLLYDGIRLNQPTYRFGANQYLNTFDLETLSAIEVVRGPSSVLFGSDAMGGVVNLVPVDPSDQLRNGGFGYRASVRYTGADQGGSGHLRLNSSRGRFAGLYEGTYRESGDLHAGGAIGNQNPTGWREADHAVRTSYRLSETRQIRADFLSVNQNEVPRYDRYVSGEFEDYVYGPQDRYLAAATFEDSQPGGFLDGLRITLAGQRELEGQRMRKTGSSVVTYTLDEVKTWGGFARLSSSLGQTHWLAYGIEYYDHRVRSDSRKENGSSVEFLRPTFPDPSRYWESGIYVQDEWSPASRLVITAGGRYSLIEVDSPLEYPFDRYTKTFADLTGSLSASYLLSPAVNLVGCWSRGFRAPSLNDAVVLKYSSSGVDAPSPDLEAETCNNFEMGVKLEDRQLRGSAFVFYNRLTDLIVRSPGAYAGLPFYDENGNGVQDEDEYDIYQKFNAEQGRIYGFEVESGAKLGGASELKTTLAWTFGENQSLHEPMTRIPPLMGSISAIRHLGSEFRIGTCLRFAGSQRRLSSNDKDDTRIDRNGTPGWVTVGLSARYNLKSTTLSLSLENLFDQVYKIHGSGIYGAGRSVNLTVSFMGR
ncbi:MAG: TonB-dependent receptor [candidate division Zixibacteria bacterium]|nr:TonB-dependent receptor [candidate division Zixibacteria bacterium]